MSSRSRVVFSDLIVINLSAVSMQVTLSGEGTLCLELTV